MALGAARLLFAGRTVQTARYVDYTGHSIASQGLIDSEPDGFNFYDANSDFTEITDNPNSIIVNKVGWIANRGAGNERRGSFIYPELVSGTYTVIAQPPANGISSNRPFRMNCDVVGGSPALFGGYTSFQSIQTSTVTTADSAGFYRFFDQMVFTGLVVSTASAAPYEYHHVTPLLGRAPQSNANWTNIGQFSTTQQGIRLYPSQLTNNPWLSTMNGTQVTIIKTA